MTTRHLRQEFGIGGNALPLGVRFHEGCKRWSVASAVPVRIARGFTISTLGQRRRAGDLASCPPERRARWHGWLGDWERSGDSGVSGVIEWVGVRVARVDEGVGE